MLKLIVVKKMYFLLEQNVKTTFIAETATENNKINNFKHKDLVKYVI